MVIEYQKPRIQPRRNFEIRHKDILSPGHLACPACGAAITMRMAIRILGPKTIIASPACCWAVIDGPFPYSATGVPFMHCAFETAAISAAGIRAGLAARGIHDINVVAWAGDGGTLDIGIQCLSACAERNEDILYICYDNEAYMNTGIQRSSATPKNTWTSTTPWGMLKKEPKKDVVAILVAHNIPYIATTTPSFPDDFRMKFERAKGIRGFRFIHVLAPCTAGWKYEERYTIELGRLAVHSKIFPLYEVFDSRRYVINVEPKGIPVQEYLKYQGRYSRLTEQEISEIQQEADQRWEELCRKARQS
jgi:pyruvate ferredoxin oxidoreductase beta subunit/2-oxoisovalerate ferredoxin oxidoreductase beta subunit